MENQRKGHSLIYETCVLLFCSLILAIGGQRSKVPDCLHGICCDAVVCRSICGNFYIFAAAFYYSVCQETAPLHHVGEVADCHNGGKFFCGGIMENENPKGCNHYNLGHVPVFSDDKRRMGIYSNSNENAGHRPKYETDGNFPRKDNGIFICTAFHFRIKCK